MPKKKRSAKSDITKKKKKSSKLTWNPANQRPKHGYHKTKPIPSSLTKEMGGLKLNKTYLRITLLNQFVVVCLSCNQSFADRLPFYFYLKNHHKRLHKNAKFNIKIVSTLERHGTEKKYIKEWGLVNLTSLEYIKPCHAYYIDKNDEQSIYNHCISNNILAMAGLSICKKFWAPIYFTKLLLDYAFEVNNEYTISMEQCVIPRETNYEPIFNIPLMLYRWNEYNNNDLNHHFPNFQIHQEPLSDPASLELTPSETSTETPIQNGDDSNEDEDDIDMDGYYIDTQTQRKSINLPSLAPSDCSSLPDSMFFVSSHSQTT